MEIFYEGQTLDGCIGAGTCINFDISEDGARLLIKSEPEYLETFRQGWSSICCVPVNKTLFFCLRWDGEWISAPYSPHLSEDGFAPAEYDCGSGMPLQEVLVNTESETVENIRLSVLGNTFSNAVSTQIKALLKQPFDPNFHRKAIDAVYGRYSSDEELAALASPALRYSAK